MIVRDLGENDYEAWRRLWDGYCAFYETEVPEGVSAATWANVIDPERPIIGRGALADDSRLVGFTLSVTHPSTWCLRPSCYLEDLFVDPAYRGSGIGKALIDDLISIAHQRDWARLYWHTKTGNATARRLYDRYVVADDFVRYRLEIG